MDLSSKPVYFISDLHLGAKYLQPARAYETRAARFIDSLVGHASELILLGDVLDYWYEYRTVAPRGNLRFFGALARLADSGTKITWFRGNHDIWLFDYLRDEIGIEIADGVVVRRMLGKNFLLSHGDGVGKIPVSFRFLRGMFRNKFLQKLYGAIHPRWTIAFAHAWSSSSRDFTRYTPPAFDPQNDPLVKFSNEYDRQHPDAIDYFVFGHRHVVADWPVGQSDARMIILGDWITHFSYGMFDGKEFKFSFFE
ncbi:MAG: UDP-2,3-diacylglucosamine diphosphatase [Muribaculaceae bacterium]|nr:UDP-2,3-diacylglucosamine diphosphatase [Muribaculaceae bacterium]